MEWSEWRHRYELPVVHHQLQLFNLTKFYKITHIPLLYSSVCMETIFTGKFTIFNYSLTHHSNMFLFSLSKYTQWPYSTKWGNLHLKRQVVFAELSSDDGRLLLLLTPSPFPPLPLSFSLPFNFIFLFPFPIPSLTVSVVSPFPFYYYSLSLHLYLFGEKTFHIDKLYPDRQCI